jgi:hypothetical protein
VCIRVLSPLGTVQTTNCWQWRVPLGSESSMKRRRRWLHSPGIRYFFFLESFWKSLSGLIPGTVGKAQVDARGGQTPRKAAQRQVYPKVPAALAATDASTVRSRACPQLLIVWNRSSIDCVHRRSRCRPARGYSPTPIIAPRLSSAT